MTLTLAELAAKLGAKLQRGETGATIDGVASLAEAGPRQLAPFLDASYRETLKTTRAGVVLASDAQPVLEFLPDNIALLTAADPEMALIAALQTLHPAPAEPAGVDARAVVEPGAVLEEGVSVGPFAVVRCGSRIGARTRIHAHVVIGRDCDIGADGLIYPNVVLYDRTKIGQRVTLHSGVVLGADGFGFKFRRGRHVKVPQIGNVIIGDDVEIGANTCIDCGALGPTRVGDGTKIDNLVQIGHGVQIGKHCILCGQAGLAGSSGMDDYAIVGGNVGLADHVFIGKGAKAAAKSGIAKDVPPGQEVFGIPAEERKVAFRQLTALKRLPDLLTRIRILEKQLAELQTRRD